MQSCGMFYAVIITSKNLTVEFSAYGWEINEICRAKGTFVCVEVKSFQLAVCVKASLELWPMVFFIDSIFYIMVES